MVDRARCPVLAIGLLAVVATASAEDSGFYLAAHGGWIRYPDHVILGPITLADPTGEPSSFSWDLSAGYRFNRYLSLELGFTDLGHYSDQVSDPQNGSFGSRSFAAKGETFAVLGTLPLGKWDLFAKAGMLHANTHLHFDGTVGGAPTVYNILADNTHPLVGLGVGYNVTKHWRLELVDTGYLHVGSGSLPQGRYEGPNLNALTFGFSFRF
jgi:OOP family OmpA-OmpF porin